jgi:hypothetical protein
MAGTVQWSVPVVTGTHVPFSCRSHTGYFDKLNVNKANLVFYEKTEDTAHMTPCSVTVVIHLDTRHYDPQHLILNDG